jgi:Flp pilus assembly protein TadG
MLCPASNPAGAPGRPTAPGPRKRPGGAAVEFALIAPLMVTFFMGTFEMSRIIQGKEILCDAARKACRTGIYPNQGNAAITQDINDILDDNHIDHTAATITILVNDQVVDAGTAKQNDKISVKVSIPIAQIAWVPSVFLGNSTIESETVVMMRQG